MPQFSTSTVALGVVLCLCTVASASAQLWPAPKSAVLKGPSRPVQSTFFFTSLDLNANLQDAITRYNSLIKLSLTDDDGAVSTSSNALINASVIVTGHDNHLGPDTDYSYEVEIAPQANVVTIQAPSVYGAMYGMETFSQMVVKGECQYSYAYIQDTPMYPHRGVLVDSGRRFAPVPLLKEIMDAMSYSKMNVLHLHLSDWGGFRVEVTGLSELTKDLDGQYYSRSDTAELVDYAVKRGIRIVPEVDLPSHSSCFAPLIPLGMEFCDSSNQLLKNTPTNVALLEKAIAGVMDAFPFSQIFHTGGDETVPQGDCTWDDIHAIEETIQKFVTAQKWRPMVWNEVFSKPSLSSAPNAALNNTIVQNWEKSTSGETTSMGFGSVSSQYKTLYLDQECCMAGPAAVTTGDNMRQCYYTDVAEGVKDTKLLYGGEVAMWSDLYCPSSHCPNQGQFSWMFPPSADDQYTASLMALIWPRAAGAAGAFWNYDADLKLNTTGPYADAITAHNSRLIARGLHSCPNGCTCDWGSQCGKPYGAIPPYPMRVELTNACDFQIKVRQRTPCDSTTGTTLAIIQPGDSYTVVTDFLVEGGKDPLKVGDPWGEWVGSAGWRDLAVKLNVSYTSATPTYLVYTQTYPTPP